MAVRTDAVDRGAKGSLPLRLALAVVAMLLALSSLPLLTSIAEATPASDGNPDLPASCGLDVTLVLDDSGSIDASEAEQVRSSAQLFADALVGTPSRVKTVVFANKAVGIDAAGVATSNLNDIVFRDPALYTTPTSGAGFGGTNWDDGLETVRRSNGGGGDLVVFITDGDPTYHNAVAPDGHLDDGTHAYAGLGNTTSPADLSQAVYEADAIKASGSKMFGIGVGFTSAASEQRLNDVTGDEELTISGGVPTPPFSEADYVVTPNFDELESVVAAFTRELCGHSLNITKYLQKADGTTVKADASNEWTYTATLDPAPDLWNNPPGVVGTTGSLTTNGNGGVSFQWDANSNAHDHLADVVETPKDGWVYNGATCTVNDFTGGPQTPLFDTAGPNAPGASGDPADLTDLPVQSDRAVNCTVYNREIRTSTVQVAKQTVPAGLPGDFSFELREGVTTIDTVSGISHGEAGTFDPVAPGTYAVVEAPDGGFDVTSAVCDDLTTPDPEAVDAASFTVGEGQAWRCTFVNTAKPGTITVVKQAEGADGTFPFTSSIPGHTSFSVATSGGTGSTAAFPVPVGHYSISESVPAQWTLSGATCSNGDVPSDIQVGPGEDVVCTFTDTAAPPSIRVVKTAGLGSILELGGPVTYSVTVVNTSVEPVTITGLVDEIDGGPALDLTVVGGPITATDCDDLVGDTLPIGGTGSCTFTATVSGPGNTTVTDEVTATAEDGDGNVATASDTAAVDIVGIPPKLEVTKTPSVPTLTEPGGPVTYTVAITNPGVEPVTLTTLTDTMESDPPVDITVVAGPITASTCGALIGTDLAAGATVSCTYTYLHTGHTAQYADGTIDDTVTVTGFDDDGPVVATADAEVALLDAPPAVTVTKTASPSVVAETAPGATRTITYTVTITNDAPEAASITAITDSVEGAPPVPASGSCPSLIGDTLAPGATVSCSFSGVVSGDVGDVIHDSVTATLTDDEGGSASDEATAQVTFTNVPSSLHVDKVADVASVPENGGPVTYTVTIRNTSLTDTITIGSITDVVDGAPPVAPGGTCTALLGTTLAPGASTSCTFTRPVLGNAFDDVEDTVTVVGTDDDGQPVSDDGFEIVQITDLPSSIAVEKIADVDSLPEPGGTVTYTVRITNTSTVDPVTIDAIEDAVNGGAPADVGGTCAALLGTVLTPGQSRTCTFTATVGEHTGDVTNDVVTVTGSDDDGHDVSAQGSESVTITDVASSLHVVKQHDVASVPEPGGPVSYTVTITNTSQVDTITLQSIDDAVGANPAAPVDGTCDDLIGTTLAAGETVTCEFTENVTGDAGDVVTDTVTVTGMDDDENTVSGQDSENVDITDVSPTITVVKSADPTTVPETAPGATTPVTYTVEITNDSPEAVVISSIQDSVEGAPATPVGGTCAALIGTSLAAGASTSCTFTGAVSGNVGDTVDDVVTVVAFDNEQNPASAFDDASVGFTDVKASLAVTKTADVASVPEPGGPVTYTVDITNTSATDPVTLTSFTDAVDGGPALPIDGTCDDLIGSTLAPGATTSCTFTTTVSGDAGDVVADTVVVSGVDDEGTPVSGEGSETVDVTDVRPAITVTKTASPSVVAETAPGATRTITYTVTIQNDSPEAVTIDAVVDSVEGAPATPVGGTCAALIGTTLAPQAGTSCTFTAQVAGDAGDTVTDLVTVSASDNDDNDVDGSDDATVTFTDVPASILVEKTADVGSVPEPGGPVTYTVTVSNTSTTDTVTISTITDVVNGGPPAAAGGTCPALVGTSLVPGGVASCTFTVDVTGNAGDTVGDTVTVTGFDDDQQPVTDDGTESVDITDVPSTLAVTKVADVDSVPEPGGPVTYTVTITNTSPADAVTIDAVVDSVGGGAAVPVDGTCDDLVGTTLAPGASVSCTFTSTVTGDAGDVVADTVTVTGTDDDDNPVEGSGSEVVDISDVASALAVTKVADVDSVPEPGGPVTYTVTITNTSPTDAVTIDAVVDSVGGGPATPVAGTCDDLVGTTLAPGASVSCTFSATVSGDAGDVVADTVTVTGTDDDGNPVTDNGSETVDVTDVPPTGTVTKTADPASLPETGGPVSLAVSVTNTSPESVTVTAITDEIDGSVYDATAVAGPITSTTCVTGTVLAPGATYSCTFTVLVPAGDAGAVIEDTVTATLVDNEQNETDPTDTEEVPLTDVAPTIVVTKANDPETLPAPGGAVAFQVGVQNTSPEPVTITSLTDAVDGGTPFDITTVSDVVTATTCETGVVIATGATYSCSFTLLVLSDEPAVVPDEVVAAVVDDDGTEAVGADTAVTTVTAVADLGVEKSLRGGSLTEGQQGTYDLVITNAGPSTAASPTVVDTLPAELTALSAVGDGWTCTIAGQQVTCTRASLAPGESSTITITVQVADDAGGRNVTNVVDVTSPTPDDDQGDNHDELTTPVLDVVPATAVLPVTGSTSADLALAGLLLVLVGGGVLLLVRRRGATGS